MKLKTFQELNQESKENIIYFYKLLITFFISAFNNIITGLKSTDVFTPIRWPITLTSWMIYNRIDGIGVGYIYAMVYLYCAHLFTISLRFFPINVLYCILFLYKDYHNEITTGLVNIWNLRLRLPIYKSD